MHISTIDVLLIEANRSDAQLAIRALQQNKLANKLVHIIDGESALDFIFCTGKYEDRNIVDTPNVIFMDVNMDGEMGLEVLRALKADQRTKQIPVVMMTSSREKEAITELKETGSRKRISAAAPALSMCMLQKYA